MTTTGLIYDTGALIAFEHGDRRMAALHQQALADGIRPRVPATVVAQAWRAGPNAQIGRLLKGCLVDEHLTFAGAKRIGSLLARTGTSDIVDAHVTLIAATHQQTVITSDPGDIELLASHLDTPVHITRI